MTAAEPPIVIDGLSCRLRGGERPYPSAFRSGRLTFDADGAVTFWPRREPAEMIRLPQGGLSVVHVRRVGEFDQAGVDWFGWLLIARDCAGVRVDVRVGGGMAHIAHRFLDRARDAPGPAVATVVRDPRPGHRGSIEAWRHRREVASRRPRLPDLPAPAAPDDADLTPTQLGQYLAIRSRREDWAGLVSRTRVTPLDALGDRPWWRIWSGRRPLEGWVLSEMLVFAAVPSAIYFDWVRAQPPIAAWSPWPIIVLLLSVLVLLWLLTRAVRVIGGRLRRWKNRVADLRRPPTQWLGYVLTVDPGGRPTVLLFDRQGTEAPRWAQRLAVSPVAEGIPVAGTAAVYGQLPDPTGPDAQSAAIVVAVNGRILWPHRPAERVGPADARTLVIG